MKKLIQRFKNKYILAITIFLVYNLFLDEVDVFSVINQNRRISQLKENQREINQKLQ